MLSPVEADADAFSGSVKDESGGVVAGATVTVLTARQAVVATTVTDPTGRFHDRRSSRPATTSSRSKRRDSASSE